LNSIITNTTRKEERKMTYVIQPGDTLFFIAGRFGVTVEDILAANPQITNPDLIFPGQIIEIPIPAPPPPPDPGITYIVQPGRHTI
jgi:spore coat assembly protein SafA